MGNSCPLSSSLISRACSSAINSIARQVASDKAVSWPKLKPPLCDNVPRIHAVVEMKNSPANVFGPILVYCPERRVASAKELRQARMPPDHSQFAPVLLQIEARSSHYERPVRPAPNFESNRRLPVRRNGCTASPGPVQRRSMPQFPPGDTVRHTRSCHAFHSTICRASLKASLDKNAVMPLRLIDLHIRVTPVRSRAATIPTTLTPFRISVAAEALVWRLGLHKTITRSRRRSNANCPRLVSISRAIASTTGSAPRQRDPTAPATAKTRPQ